MTHDEETGRTVLVVTRTKDRPVLLRRAMESVLGQTRGEWLHVIVNDGGDPVSVDLLAAEFAGRYRGRLKVFHNAKSLGMQNASNLAIRGTESEYVTIHDDDDSWEPAFLEKAVGRLEAAGPESLVQGVVTHTQWIFEEIDAHGRVVELYRREFPSPGTIRLAEVAGENRFPPIAFVYRRRVHEAIGYFNEAFSVLGDWDFNLRFLSRFEIGVVPEKLARWHWRHQGGGTAYGNSCTAGVSEHQEKEARLYNHYLRMDLEAGKPGLGHLMNVSRPLVQLSHQVAELRGRVEQGAGAAAATLSHAEHLHRITRDLARVWGAKEWVRRGAAIVRERRAQAVEAPPPGVRDLRGEVERAVESLKPGDVLSLDVFDTALLRVLRHPTDLFAWMEPEAQAALGRPGYPFAQARAAAERVARDRHEREGCEDVTLAQIHAVLAEMAGAEAEAGARTMELEIAAERRLGYAHPLILEASRAARRRGVRVVFVSDMYLPSEVIRGLLELNGYEAPEVFVSCEAGKTKHSGGLFEEVLRALEIAPERMLHVGDHPESDGGRPGRMGIRTLLLDRRDYGAATLADEHAALTGTGRREVMSSLFTGLARRRNILRGTAGDIWDRLGYEVAADGVRLCAMDRGAVAGGGGGAAVFPGAGRALAGAGVPDVRGALGAGGGTGLHVFLAAAAEPGADRAAGRGGVSFSADGGSVFAGAGFSGADRAAGGGDGGGGEAGGVGGSRRGDHDAGRVFPDAGASRGDAAGAGRPGGVDSGAGEKGARDAAGVLRGDRAGGGAGGGGGSGLAGVVGAVGAGPAAAGVAGVCAARVLFRDVAGGGGGGGRRVSAGVVLLPCGATGATGGAAGGMRGAAGASVHGAACDGDGAGADGGGWRPVCGERETTAEQRANLERVAAGAMAFTADWLKIETWLTTHAAPMGYLESVLERVLRRPTRAEAAVIGELPHRDSFGGRAPWRHLAKVPSAAQAVLRPSSVREAHERAYWKAGFLAQLGPTERGMV